jgi:hypothetical protein
MTMSIGAWVDRYRQCWEASDADGVAALFTEDASYRSNIFEDAHEGTPASAGTGTRSPRSSSRSRCGWTSRSRRVIGPPSSGGRPCATTEARSRCRGCLVLRFDDTVA